VRKSCPKNRKTKSKIQNINIPRSQGRNVKSSVKPEFSVISQNPKNRNRDAVAIKKLKDVKIRFSKYFL
jgi:hypothetical protein